MAVRCEKSPGAAATGSADQDRSLPLGLRGRSGAMVRNSTYKRACVFWQKTVRAATASTPRRGQPGGTAKATCSLYQQPASEHIGIAVTALVDAELFATRRRSGWRRIGGVCGHPAPAARYLLQGLLVCGSCGYGLSVQTSGLQQKYTYYTCPGVYVSELTHRRVCPNGRQRTEAVEAAVWADVSALLSEPPASASGVSAASTEFAGPWALR